MPTSTVIKLVPKLSIAALKTNIDRELTLWYCLRAINYWGSGHLELQMAIESLTLHFHYSKSIAYRILSSGDGIFGMNDPYLASTAFKSKSTGLKEVMDTLLPLWLFHRNSDY